MASQAFHTLAIDRVRQLTDDAVALRFDVPANLTDTFTFVPGQYVTLRAPINGADIRRSYSICSSVNDNGFEVGIKAVTDGQFSSWAQTLKIGDQIDVMPAQGRFQAPIGGQHDYLLIAAGSGITPCLSIAKSVLDAEPQSKVTLIFGNRSTQSVMFRDDLDILKDSHLERMIVMHVLSGEQQDVDILNGRISAALIKELNQRKLVHLSDYDGIYICGPQAMTVAVSDMLVESGIGEDAIHIELFMTDNPPKGKGKSKRPSAPQPESDDTEIPVTLILDGVHKEIKVHPDTETVLAAAQRAGLDVPYSCAGGMCCTCRCRIVTGSADMDVNYSLQQWEIDQGFTLACQSRPTSDTLTLDFDAS